VKNFEAFLKESYVGKDGNIYASKNEAEKTIAKINQLKTDKLKDEISKRTLKQKRLEDILSRQYSTDGGYGDSNTGAGANTQNNPPPKNTVIKPKPGEIKTSKEILKQTQPGTNVTINPSKTNVTKSTSTVTTNVTNTNNPLGASSSSSSGGKVKTTKPTVTTNVTNPKRFKNFLDRVLVSTGVKTDPKYKSKFTTPSSNVTVSGAQSGTNKVLKDVGKKALRSKIFRGLGRFAGGAFAVKDALDKARDERRLGRSKTSQILGGLAKGAGGYLGGALGATLGTLAGGGIGSFALGTGGAITGYNLGSRAGEYLYNKGRELATGETKLKLPGKKTFKNFKDKIKGLDLRNLGRTDKDKK
tara:strand:+ start:976 stop:2049 length:1074 start_codon:yes stop_codon:yes gene_type:complete